MEDPEITLSTWRTDQVAMALYDLGVSGREVREMFAAVGRTWGDVGWRFYWRQIGFLSCVRRAGQSGLYDQPRGSWEWIG